MNLTETSSVARDGIPTAVRLIDAVILSLITAIGITGNTLVFVAYALSHKIRTKTNIFVLNLAIADFFTCLFLPSIAWSLFQDVGDVITWQLDIMCGIAIAAITIFASTSIILLFSISVNRFILITRSHQTYKQFYRKRNVVIWLLVSWTYPFLTNLVPLQFGVGHLGFDINTNTCGSRTDHEHVHLYDLIIVMSVLPMPFAVTICYVSIFVYIRKHNRRMMAYYYSPSQRAPRSVQTVRNDRSMAKGNNRDVNLNITKNLFVVLLTYLVCVTPHIVCEVIDAPHVVILHTSILVACNNCLNPIIYGLKHPHFRQVFKCIIFRRWTEIPQPAFRWMNIHQQAHSRDVDSAGVKTSTHFSYNTVSLIRLPQND